MHQVCGHSNGDLFIQEGVGVRVVWSCKQGERHTPAGIVHCLYCKATSGETRGSLCMMP